MTDQVKGTILGLSAGATRGSAEILLKSALRGAEEEGVRSELVRLNELRLSLGGEADDGEWLWEKLVACDALIISTPIISRTVSALLKILVDRLLGPKADAAFVERMLQLRAAGRDLNLPFQLDERVLKPRVAGFIAVGGSLTSQWKALALPVMHTTAFSMHMAVADQMVCSGAGTPRSIVLQPDALGRAAQLGRNVGSQLGRPYDQVEYRGEPGLCPLCHLDVIVLHDREIECASCGARGILAATASVRWTDTSTSVISMDEKWAHIREVEQTAAEHATRRQEIEALAASFDDFAPVSRPEAVHA